MVSGKIGRYCLLKPTKQRGCNKRIFGFDIETYDDNKSFLMASITSDDEKWIFRDKHELIDFFKTKKFNNSIIVASNLAFDFMGTFFGEKEIKDFDWIFRGSSMIYAKTYIHHKQFQKSAQTQTGKAFPIWFIDTFNYCNLSVEKLGKILKFPKLDKPDFLGKYPKNETEWKIMIDYNVRDSQISEQYMKFLYDSFITLGASPKLTIASTSMSLFKNKYLDCDYFRHPIDVLDDLFKGYYGGRTEAFKRGSFGYKEIESMGEVSVTSDIYNYYDFNSLYPSVMINDYPNPNTLRTNHRNTLRYINEYHGMSDVTIFCPDMKIPLLPVRTNDKLIFPTGEFRGWYTHIELRKAIDEGYTIIEVHKCHYYKETCRPFDKYVTDLYKLRQKYKKEKSPMESVVKLHLNSLYGKFGQKFRNVDDYHPFNHSVEELSKLDNFERVGDFIRIKQELVNPSAFCIPIWACYVTAYGRMKLWDTLVISDPLYCDTDSIITKKNLPCSDKLGDLKLEMTISHGIIVKPKFYAFSSDKGDTVKIKGVAKHLSMTDFDNLMSNPKVEYIKFMKFKESIRRGFIPNELQDTEKNLSLEDTKRNWLKPFNSVELQDSEPLSMQNFKYSEESKKYIECSDSLRI